MAEKKQVQQADMYSNEPEFAIQRLYVKDLSFEVPHSPLVFLEEWQPEVNMDLTTKANDLGGDNHEIVLTVTVNVTMKDKTIFLAEVHQGGMFTIKNFPKTQMRPMLGSFCPNILYPYAREAITDVVMRGGFPQLYLAPVNFDTLLEQQNHSQDGECVH
ncbi:MAG: protein-export chaperone SecB [Coxiella-like endosymbiont]|uniref:protein-export chaperone SecB n=1 Tax=Coxiella-like endosymbiont TaxID=1592897 RepID=UPI00215AD409|nr:protein-export chaperone SecB [Coxiella-like endosymbiont]UVE59346.1 protein-export chaperone SecB [Coxiella-like endosymbiont]